MTSNLLTDHYRVEKKRQDGYKNKPVAEEAKAPIKRITEGDLDKLRKFDLDWNFGPSIGISRLERWERASKYGMNPPQEIKDLILRHANSAEYTESVWNDYKIL